MKQNVHMPERRMPFQQLIIALWGATLGGVVALWLPLGTMEIQSGIGGFYLGAGQLLGLLATFFALTQFLLMGRIPWIEHQFGMDRLAIYHRLNGYLSIGLIVVHPIFLTLHHMVLEHIDFTDAYISIYAEHPYTVWALIAELLFVGVVFSSMYIARKHLKFETWYFVHLMVYAAIVLASFHQFANGGTLIASPVAKWLWIGLYAFVVINIVVWRFGIIALNSVWYRFTVSRVVRETPTVISVYIRAKNAQRLHVKPGQFILVRFLTKDFWWQEHPFTVSWIPHSDELRITVRAVGDYTASIATLKPGARVAISGPFGRFTSEIAQTDKKLLIAGGIGITPLRCIFEEESQQGGDAILLYANKTSRDVPLGAELDALASSASRIHYIFSEERVKRSNFGSIDLSMIKTYAPDYKDRDIYLCGPPAMVVSLNEQLTKQGVAPGQIHHELFSLHP